MLMCMNKVFLACGVSKERSEGAVFSMWHWRVGGDIHRKFQPLSSWRSGQKFKKMAETNAVLLSTYVILGALAS